MTMLPLRLAARPLTVLCLGAHCDDIEIGCAATLLGLAAERPSLTVRWVVFSGNAVRREEARASAEALLAGAARTHLEFHSFRESYFPYHGAEIKESFERLKGEIAPDLVFTHWKADQHQDHRTIAELTWNSFRDHLILEYEIPKYDGDLGNPNLFLPLPRALAERKAAHLLTHFPSQRTRAWFTPDTFLALMRLRGTQCNAPSGLAEGFHCRKMVFAA
ncbi:MAG: PIG-L family deacetylase [Rhodospirillales bacterium]|nr:PIG-L family deacetylase [Rhodospirillales bacterium]